MTTDETGPLKLDPNNTTLAQRIDAFIYHAGFSKRHIAQVAGIRPSTISSVCLGTTNPNLTTLSQIAKALTQLTHVHTEVADLLMPRLPRPPFRRRTRPKS